MTGRIVSILVSSILGVLVLSGPAHAWDPLTTCGGNYTAWDPGSPNTIWKFSSGLPSGDIGVGETKELLDAAFDEWGMPGCSEFSASQGPDTTADPLDNYADQAVGFYENEWPWSLGSALAVTFMNWWGDCSMSEASMVFNGYDFTWSVGSWANDFQSVATHEAGHWVGLDHSWYPGSSLNSTYSGGTGERTLSCDDTEAACALYPQSGTACGPPAYDDYCPCGQSCINGWCDGVAVGDPWGTGDDDDDNGDDDDTGTPPSEGCDGPLETLSESEPNDWDGSNDYDVHVGEGGDVTISGTIACAPQWSADMDWFHVEFPCEDQARVTLDWSGNSDLDFWVFDADEDLLAQNNDEDYSGPVTEQVYARDALILAVGCWTGPSESYTIEVDYKPWGSPPPEEEGDDDDDDGDDDDSEGTAGDDDDTTPEEELPPEVDDSNGGSPEPVGVSEDPIDGMGCGCSASRFRRGGGSFFLLALVLALLPARRGQLRPVEPAERRSP